MGHPRPRIYACYERKGVANWYVWNMTRGALARQHLRLEAKFPGEFKLRAILREKR